MAEAQKRVQVTSVDLYLSIEEARALRQVLMHVGGRQDNKYYANLRDIELALERAGDETIAGERRLNVAKAQKRTGVTTVNLDMNLAEAQLLATLLDRVAGHHECTNYKRLRGLREALDSAGVGLVPGDDLDLRGQITVG